MVTQTTGGIEEVKASTLRMRMSAPSGSYVRTRTLGGSFGQRYWTIGHSSTPRLSTAIVELAGAIVSTPATTKRVMGYGLAESSKPIIGSKPGAIGTLDWQSASYWRSYFKM